MYEETHTHLFLKSSYKKIVKIKAKSHGLSEAHFMNMLISLKLVGYSNRFQRERKQAINVFLKFENWKLTAITWIIKM